MSKNSPLFSNAAEIELNARRDRWLLVRQDFLPLSLFEREEVIAIIEAHTTRMTSEQIKILRDIAKEEITLIEPRGNH